MKNTQSLCLLLAITLLCSFAPADWIAFQNTEGNFKILFPRQPQQTEQDVETGIGKLKVTLFMYQVDKYKDDNMLYGINVTNYPDTMISSDFKDEILDKFFAGSVSGAAKNIDGTVISQKKIKYKGYPGISAKISFADKQGIMYMQMFLINSRGYILEVGCEPKHDNNASINKFFNSFALLNDKK